MINRPTAIHAVRTLGGAREFPGLGQASSRAFDSRLQGLKGTISLFPAAGGQDLPTS